MQGEGSMLEDGGANGKEATCAFCRRELIPYILKETPRFLLATDHAPLVEGHLLIIPKEHYPCYGAVPAGLDEELYMLKQEVKQFFAGYYAPAVFWEHGVFRQTVFHAHLHCFPFGETAYDLSSGLHGKVVQSQEDIRAWYRSRGQYFYLEDTNVALLFAPEMELYLRVIQDVLWHGVASRNHQTSWRSQEQRYLEGGPLIQATAGKWRLFQTQKQGVEYAGETGFG